jgi:fructosamine-3-kinase
MLNDSQLRKAIADSITLTTDQPFIINNIIGSSGGCINTCFVAESETRHYFIKTNRADAISMFEAESQALDEIANTQTIRVPLPVCVGHNSKHSWLVMENLQMQTNGRQQQFGEQLAAMHNVTSSQYGWVRDNTIGSTPQINTQSNNWVDFFRDQRLDYQLSLAASNGYRGSLQKSGDALMECIADFFDDYSPLPSLLHGDLWGGNYAFLENGEPVIFDPALYYGDRETDIAMTELFGGFNSEFRASYEACWPLDAGYETRKQLYNCYHILNHLNLFGGGYASQAENTMKKLLSERNA